MYTTFKTKNLDPNIRNEIEAKFIIAFTSEIAHGIGDRELMDYEDEVIDEMITEGFAKDLPFVTRPKYTLTLWHRGVRDDRNWYMIRSYSIMCQKLVSKMAQIIKRDELWYYLDFNDLDEDEYNYALDKVGREVEIESVYASDIEMAKGLANLEDKKEDGIVRVNVLTLTDTETLDKYASGTLNCVSDGIFALRNGEAEYVGPRTEIARGNYSILLDVLAREIPNPEPSFYFVNRQLYKVLIMKKINGLELRLDRDMRLIEWLETCPYSSPLCGDLDTSPLSCVVSRNSDVLKFPEIFWAMDRVVRENFDPSSFVLLDGPQSLSAVCVRIRHYLRKFVTIEECESIMEGIPRYKCMCKLEALFRIRALFGLSELVDSDMEKYFLAPDQGGVMFLMFYRTWHGVFGNEWTDTKRVVPSYNLDLAFPSAKFSLSSEFLQDLTNRVGDEQCELYGEQFYYNFITVCRSSFEVAPRQKSFPTIRQEWWELFEYDPSKFSFMEMRI